MIRSEALQYSDERPHDIPTTEVK